jgi:hypothetical protein
LKKSNQIKIGGGKMKIRVSIITTVVFLAAIGVFVLGQNAFAGEPGIRFIMPENLQEVNPGDKINVSGIVEGVRQLDESNRLSIRVGRHKLPLQSRRNRFTSEFEVSKRNHHHKRRWRGSRRHGVIYIWGRVKIDDRYYFDKVKLRVKRDRRNGYGKTDDD